MFNSLKIPFNNDDTRKLNPASSASVRVTRPHLSHQLLHGAAAASMFT
jgi:hypothetical protein